MDKEEYILKQQYYASWYWKKNTAMGERWKCSFCKTKPTRDNMAWGTEGQLRGFQREAAVPVILAVCVGKGG